MPFEKIKGIHIAGAVEDAPILDPQAPGGGHALITLVYDRSARLSNELHDSTLLVDRMQDAGIEPARCHSGFGYENESTSKHESIPEIESDCPHFHFVVNTSEIGACLAIITDRFSPQSAKTGQQATPKDAAPRALREALAFERVKKIHIVGNTPDQSIFDVNDEKGGRAGVTLVYAQATSGFDVEDDTGWLTQMMKREKIKPNFKYDGQGFQNEENPAIEPHRYFSHFNIATTHLGKILGCITTELAAQFPSPVQGAVQSNAAIDRSAFGPRGPKSDGDKPKI